ncbi:unnamed protein product [Dicrocoelium dendriticum]|nr:unnamed protein product [Dicrocoelium dendriticum]
MSHFLTGCAKEDALLVSVLKSLGAVPFARTTVPQTMLSVVSSNPIDGMTRNPLDLNRSPAGSSSGEAALIGGGGSVFGLGTDLGGSIRLPAAMCNIVGFKPTPGRLSQLGMFKIHRLTTVTSTPGPLARDVETCMSVVKALFNSHLHREFDYFVPPLKYSDEHSFEVPLRIGYFVTDGSFTPVPAAQRAVMHVKAKLEARGHELVPWQPPFKGCQWLSLFVTGVYADGMQPLLRALHYDAIDEAIAGTVKLMRAWRITRYWKYLLTRFFGSPDDLVVLRALSAVHDIPSMLQHTQEVEAFRRQIYSHWREARLDALICPAFGLAAPPPLKPKHRFTGMLSYLNLFNLANMPAGCLPSGISVCEDDLAALKPSVDGSSTRYQWNSLVLELQRDIHGFPVSIQVAAAPWRDEICLHVMREVEDAVKCQPNLL